MSIRARKLAERIDEGASLLASFARGLTDAQWHTIVLPDGRTVGVLVHHVASMYPIEMALVEKAVAGQAITDVTWDVVAGINAEHSRKFAGATIAEALELLAINSRIASDAVRLLSDDDLDRAVPFSLNSGAPMTVQFIIEDHALKHPWHHLVRMQKALAQEPATFASAA